MMLELNPNLPTVDNFSDIILGDQPIIDLRAPIEFARGSIPCAVNLPLLNDDERAAVGKEYKKNGQDNAVKLGLKLIAGDTQKRRIDAWCQFIKQNPTAILMCFRGGMRSAIAQQWLFDNYGLVVPRIAGGYKTMRHFFMAQFDEEALDIPFVLLGGHTGAGKTIVIKALDNAVDLEGIAVHRGSAFGNYIAPQPSQIDFENNLAKKIMQLRSAGVSSIVLEKESKNIGKSRLPDGFYDKMQKSPVVVLEATLSERIDNTWQDYVIDDLAKYRTHYGNDGDEKWATHLRDSILRLSKRLGGDRTQHVVKLFDDAIVKRKLEDHKLWIEFLLVNYYDPMYGHYKEKWLDRAIFAGDRAAVEDFLKSYNKIIQ